MDTEASAWAARLDRGLNVEEEAALDTWLIADRRHQGAFLRQRAALSLLDRARALHGKPADPVIEEVSVAPDHAPSRRRLLSYGTGLAAALTVGATWQFWPRARRIKTDVGEIRHIPLEDGSVAMVNSGSALRIAFTEHRRDVTLASGEAWFQVAKNHSRPFTVAAGPAVAQAVGTAFDVRRHADSTEIIVTEGTVKVWPLAATQEAVLIEAGHRVVVDRYSNLRRGLLDGSASDQRLAWREGRIVLDRMKLGAAVEEFNRYHVEQLEIDPSLSDREVVGWFSTDDINGFATTAASLVGGHVERDGSTIWIKKSSVE
ncbi:iron dicitrate transport regulator FecR [Sphingomonas populi]|uniref:Iron dicitrate transport regulator FecR n=1 Tax=Sphingomonas populi TaxID=2484750 RepID=A0A4Q6XR98_9SPHN|nr:iron dicitrate transport regulator FecR [Sphingomonas populi]